MKVSYFQRGNHLWVRLTTPKSVVRFSSQIKCPPDADFDTKKQEFLGRSTKVMASNSKLAASRALILQLASQGLDVQERYKAEFVEEAPEFQNEGMDMIRLMDEFISAGVNAEGQPYSPNSLSLFRCSMEKLKAWGRPIDLIDFDMAQIQEIRKRMEVGERWKKYWKAFDKYMADEEEMMSNGRASYFRMINRVINWAETTYYIHLPPCHIPSSQESPIVVLDPDFVRTFINTEGQGLDKYMFELSAMILTSTLRISDVLSLKRSSFVKVGSSYHLNKMNKKTGAYSTVPLHPVVDRFIQDNLREYGTPFSKQMAHNGIRWSMPKFFSQFPECQHDITVVDDGEEITAPLWTFCKPHMLRKSAITRMILEGVDIRFIKFASGHTGDSKAFERYVAHVDRVFRNGLVDYYANT